MQKHEARKGAMFFYFSFFWKLGVIESAEGYNALLEHIKKGEFGDLSSFFYTS